MNTVVEPKYGSRSESDFNSINHRQMYYISLLNIIASKEVWLEFTEIHQINPNSSKWVWMKPFIIIEGLEECKIPMYK